jgi:hypothetical protein
MDMGEILRLDPTAGHSHAVDGTRRARSEASVSALCRLPQHASVQVGVGNHEVDTHENEFRSARGNDSGGECGIATLKRFPQFTSSSEMWCVITDLSQLEAA